MAAEGIAAPLAECLLGALEIQGNRLDRITCWQVLSNDKQTTGRDSALNRLASGFDEFATRRSHVCDRFVFCSSARPRPYSERAARADRMACFTEKM